jgi:rSAM/selenodomain-associated transferase 1
MQDALIVFVRKPELGGVKTRLAKEVGAHQALAIYEKLLRHTFEIIQSLPCDKYTFVSGEGITTFWDGYSCIQQKGDDLGARMHNAFDVLFKKGYHNLVIIGSDCLQLTTALLQQAFAQLQEHDVVIGPATDGGYYLLGMKQLHTQLFRNKSWSTATVYHHTVQDINEAHLKLFQLPMLSDVDEAADVPAEWL